jgi:hypothetical protein
VEDNNMVFRQLRVGLSSYQLLKRAFGPWKQLEKCESEGGIQLAQKDTLVAFYRLDSETSVSTKTKEIP